MWQDGGPARHDHSNSFNGGPLAASLLLGIVALTGALSGVTGYFTGSVGAGNVTASSMTVSGEVAVATIRFPDNSTLTTAPGASFDFGPSTAALSVSTSALASRLGNVASSTNTLSASTATLASRFDPVAASTTSLSASTAALASRFDPVAASTTSLSASTAALAIRFDPVATSTTALSASTVTLAQGPTISSQTSTVNIDLAQNIQTVVSTVSFTPLAIGQKIRIDTGISFVRLGATAANWSIKVRRSSQTACAIGTNQIDSAYTVHVPNIATATFVADPIWIDKAVSTDTHFYCISASHDQAVLQRVSTRTVTATGWR